MIVAKARAKKGNQNGVEVAMKNEKKILIGIENEFEGRSLAWVYDFPGCFAYGSNETEALVRVPQALLAYKSWLEGNTGQPWQEDLADFDIRLVEVVKCYSINDQFEPDKTGDREVNAWFHYDWRILTAEEIARALPVLQWAHRDLYELTAGLSPEQLAEQRPGERWSISGILNHGIQPEDAQAHLSSDHRHPRQIECFCHRSAVEPARRDSGCRPCHVDVVFGIERIQKQCL